MAPWILSGNTWREQIHYELARTGRFPCKLFEILQPGQEIILEEGRFFLDADLDLLIDEND